MLVLKKRKDSSVYDDKHIFNAITSISQLDSEKEMGEGMDEAQSIIEKSFFKRTASSFDDLFHNGAFSKGKGIQVITNCDEVA